MVVPWWDLCVSRKLNLGDRSSLEIKISLDFGGMFETLVITGHQEETIRIKKVLLSLRNNHTFKDKVKSGQKRFCCHKAA